MNILQVVELMHKYLKGELTSSELPSSDQVEKAKSECYTICEALVLLAEDIPEYKPVYLEPAYNAAKLIKDPPLRDHAETISNRPRS